MRYECTQAAVDPKKDIVRNIDHLHQMVSNLKNSVMNENPENASHDLDRAEAKVAWIREQINEWSGKDMS
jgi:hypothetical protein